MKRCIGDSGRIGFGRAGRQPIGSAARRGLAAALACLVASAACAATPWEYAQFRDPDSGGVRHTVQTKIEYEGAIAALAFVCSRGNLVLTVVSTWPIAGALRYRFPPESARWLGGITPVPSSAVFQGDDVRKLFETALVRREIMIRIPGPRTITEKTVALEGFAAKAEPLREACPEK